MKEDFPPSSVDLKAMKTGPFGMADHDVAAKLVTMYLADKNKPWNDMFSWRDFCIWVVSLGELEINPAPNTHSANGDDFDLMVVVINGIQWLYKHDFIHCAGRYLATRYPFGENMRE